MFKTLATMSLAAGIAVATFGTALAADKAPVKIGWAAWSDAEFVTKLAAKLIKDELGQEVELVQTDVAPRPVHIPSTVKCCTHRLTIDPIFSFQRKRRPRSRRDIRSSAMHWSRHRSIRRCARWNSSRRRPSTRHR